MASAHSAPWLQQLSASAASSCGLAHHRLCLRHLALSCPFHQLCLFRHPFCLSLDLSAAGRPRSLKRRNSCVKRRLAATQMLHHRASDDVLVLLKKAVVISEEFFLLRHHLREEWRGIILATLDTLRSIEMNLAG